MIRIGTALMVAAVVSFFSLHFYAHHVWSAVPTGTTIDRLVVEKSARRLSIFANGKELKTYRVALGRNFIGPKREEGDMKTPEGIYKIDGRNPQSSFHLALHISYPSDEDNARAAERGLPVGFDIMIHGIQNGRGWIGAFHRRHDWTAGCIALTDEEIEELGVGQDIFDAQHRRHHGVVLVVVFVHPVSADKVQIRITGVQLLSDRGHMQRVVVIVNRICFFLANNRSVDNVAFLGK